MTRNHGIVVASGLVLSGLILLYWIGDTGVMSPVQLNENPLSMPRQDGRESMLGASDANVGVVALDASDAANSASDEHELAHQDEGEHSLVSSPQVDAYGQTDRAKKLAAMAAHRNPEFLVWVEESFTGTELDSARAKENEDSVLASLERVFAGTAYESLVVCSDDVCRLEMPRSEYMVLIRSLSHGADVIDGSLFLSVDLIGVHRAENGRTIAHVVRKDADFDVLLNPPT